MTEPADLGTDAAWEEWGRRDPYYGVITNPKFRRAAIDEEARRQFFESGASHADHVLKTVRGHINGSFSPRRILDFGCGVGRVLLPFAATAEQVVGADVSSAMLQEAQRNCDQRSLHNVHLLISDDSLSTLSGTFDLIHSCIVFQHIPVERGRRIFSRLLEFLSPGGVAAIQLTYSKTRFAPTHGVAPLEPQAAPSVLPATLPDTNADPEMQMNPYNMNEIMFALQHRGVQRCYVEFSDHGGELGVFLYFSVPEAE